jgi:hypothetical protein
LPIKKDLKINKFKEKKNPLPDGKENNYRRKGRKKRLRKK